jgi:hypothetical protein
MPDWTFVSKDMILKSSLFILDVADLRRKKKLLRDIDQKGNLANSVCEKIKTKL